MQKFRPKLISKIRDFGQNSAIFDSDNPREVNNEFGDTKNVFEGFGTSLVRVENFSTTPPQKARFWGAEISAKLHFSA